MLTLRFITLCALLVLVCGQGSRKQSPARRQHQRTTPEPVSDDDGTTDECPEPYGYFADATQCDKYYACSDGAITERICDDGLVFNDVSSLYDKCDLPFNIDCSSRPERQTPQPSLHCPRKHGYFAHENETVCDKFYYCVDGKFNMITCPDGLVYNDKTGICTWPDEAKKKGCLSKDVFKFTCPKTGESEPQQHPRYADPDDCQFFYVCINSEVPRRNGCKRGQVFNDATKICDWPRNVPECVDWYKGVISDAELAAIENPKPRPRPSTTVYKSRNGGRKQSQSAEEEEE